jgi:hypothetical protein
MSGIAHFTKNHFVESHEVDQKIRGQNYVGHFLARASKSQRPGSGLTNGLSGG